MPFKKGHTKTGGRRKGVPNKDSLPLHEKARELGVDPFRILLLFAKGDWEGLGYPSETEVRCGKGGETYEVDRITSQQRLAAASDACQYLYPKRKAIEVNDARDPGEDPCAELTDEQLDEA